MVHHWWYKVILFSFIFLNSYAIHAIEHFTFKTLPLKNNAKQKILSSKIYSKSKVLSYTGKNKEKLQSLELTAAGLHPKSCKMALRKLKNYEDYKNFVGFVKESSYGPKEKKVRFLLSSSLLPIDMILKFQVDRISKPGLYPFLFTSGFLKGLKGNLHISKHKKRCLFFLSAKWKGQNSGFNSIIFEFFTSTLSEVGLKNLFRASKI